jgi:MFS family permease
VTNGSRGLFREPVFIVAVGTAIAVAIGFGLVVPIIPAYARQFGVGVFAATAVVATFSGVRLVSNPYSGVLADRLGRRRSVGTGALIVALSSLLTAGAPTYWALLVFRAAGGFGSALFINSLQALVLRAVAADQRGRAIGVLQGAFLFGIAAGPAVGGVLSEALGLRLPFVIYAGSCAAAAAIAWTFLPQESQARPVGDGGFSAGSPDEADGPASGAAPAPSRAGLRGLVGAARRLARTEGFVAAALMMAADRWAAQGLRFSLVPLFGEEVVGASQGLVGIGLTVAVVGQAAALWPAGKAADTLGRRKLALPAIGYFGATVLALGLVRPLWAFFVVLALYGVGTALTSVVPPAIVGDVVDEAETGLGIGVLNAAGDLGTVAGLLVSGLLAEVAFLWGFVAPAVLLVVAAVVMARTRETLPARPAP